MAKSGTLYKYFTVNNYDNLAYTTTAAKATYSLALSWEVIGTDIINGTSTIKWSISASVISFKDIDGNMSFGTPSYLRFGTDDIQYVGNYDTYPDVIVQVDGTTIYEIHDLVADVHEGETVTLASDTFTVTHDINGAYSGSISCTVRPKNVYDTNNNPAFTPYGDTDLGADSRANISGTMTLDNLPKHAVLLSAPERFTDEDNPTITFAIPSGVTNVKAYISFSTSTIDIGSYAVSGSSYTFNFDEAEKKKLWSILDQGLNTKQVYFYVMSNFQGELYHSEPIISTLEVINYTPIINSNVNEIYDTNEKSKLLTGDKYRLIRYVSNAYYNIGAEGRKGAEIEGVSIKNGTLTKYSSTGTFEGVTSPIFEYTATDSRGNSIPLTTTDFSARAGYWIPYVKLTCSSSATEMTADGDVIVTLKGKYFNGNFSASKRNRLRMHYDTVKDGEDLGMTDMGYIDFSDSRGNFSYNSTTSEFTYTFTIPNLIYTSVYEITVRVSDEVAVQGTETQLILASTPIFDWGRTDFNFNVDVTMQENLTVNGNIKLGSTNLVYIQQQGTSSGWNYRLWSDGVAECWRNLTVSTTISNTSAASWYSSGELSATNLSYPFTFTAVPTVNVNIMPTGTTWAIVFPSNTAGSTTKTGSYQLNSMSQATTSKNYLLSYNVKGRWK